MNDQKLFALWESQNQKLEETLKLNKKLVREITKGQLRDTIGSLRSPKLFALLIAIPYTLLLCFFVFIGKQAGAPFVVIGFGLIALIMTALIIGYLYHIYLINQIQGTDEISKVQKQIAELKVSSFNLTRLAVLQLPLWSICWISLDVLKSSPLLYGGVNLLIFLLLSYIAYWLYQRLNVQNSNSKVYKFFYSGNEWDPIIKSSHILEQIKEYDS
ncbi:MAG: hypothetical protein HKO89_03825 [Saprospiraceae bacterium]|nr:hypothetical protein [Saprospiraceae bacterium]